MKYKVNDIVRGKVTGIESYGIFISLDDNVTGLIHISQISDSFVKNVSDYVEIGEVIPAKIIEIDEKNNKLKLSLKDFHFSENTKKLHPIEETKSGFSELKNSLDKWISLKEEEIRKNQKKQ